MGIFSKIFGFIGGLGASSSEGLPEICCYYWMLDEPECPKSLIEK